DHLLPFGAEGGLMPGKTAEETMILRDAIMRWEYPHRHFNWDSLAEGVRELSAVKVTTEDLVRHAVGNETKLYTLSPDILERMAQIALTLHQVLLDLYAFLQPEHLHPFQLEPGWQLLCQMEENLSRSQIVGVFRSLQYCLQQAVKHVRRQLNSIKKVYQLQNLDDVSTVNSTRSSVCTAFGQDDREVELEKLAARPDY
ncbi:hypothetical protein B0H19DRAFT_890637, partial [Mycena capillaripes]